MSNFDFDKMMNLFKQDPEAFEKERQKIISDYIDTLPEESQQKAHDFQASLDAQRKTMSSENFMNVLSAKLKENLADLQDNFKNINSIASGDTEINNDTKNKVVLISNKIKHLFKL